MDYEGKLSPQSILKKFSKKTDFSKLKHLNVNSSQISDALNNLTSNSGVIPDLMPLFDTTIIGRAVTALTDADDWGTSVKGIEKTKKGEILFIGVEGDYNAVWGELTSRTAKEKGIVATVICGAVRDVKAIKEMKYPVFLKKIVPNAGKPKGNGKINVPIKCGNITVNPQDIIIGDQCGVVVIPKAHLTAVIDEALSIKRKEKMIISKIEQGHTLFSILKLK